MLNVNACVGREVTRKTRLTPDEMPLQIRSTADLRNTPIVSFFESDLEKLNYRYNYMVLFPSLEFNLPPISS